MPRRCFCPPRDGPAHGRPGLAPLGRGTAGIARRPFALRSEARAARARAAPQWAVRRLSRHSWHCYECR
eukprot:3997824-Pyramimonas_sp.AAC.1